MPACSCLFKPPGVFALPGVTFLQLVAGLLERALILADGVLCRDMVRLSVSSLVERPAAVFSKSCTPALASLKADCASWICFCTEREFAGKVVAVASDSDTTRSRSVSLKRGSPAFGICGSALDKTRKTIYTLYKPTWEGYSCRYPSNRGGTARGSVFLGNFFASAGIKPNDVLTAEVIDGKIVLSKQFQHRTLQQRAAAFDGKLNLSGEYDWGEPMGNEVW